MWPSDTPESRLQMINNQLESLRSEAERVRMAKREAERGEVTIAVSGRHLHIGSIVIVFGRMLREDGSHI